MTAHHHAHSQRGLTARVLLGWIAALLLGACNQQSPSDRQAQPALHALHAAGTRLVTASSQPVTLVGCNLGNWLLIEPWMLGRTAKDGVADQYTFEKILTDRFGAAEAHRLMELYRRNWITPRDLALVKSFGFNVVRVPFHYSLLEDDAQPMRLRPGAFDWLDRAVQMAEQAGLYVILDLHGVAGGQSLDAPTGRVGQNRFWSDAACQDRTLWLWEQIALYYRGRSSIAAFDLINEPFSDEKEDVRPALAAVIDRLHAAVRRVDPDRVLFAPGVKQNAEFYGSPASRGWTNVGFTEHFYPGLYGWNEPSLETHANFIAHAIARRDAFLAQASAPFLVGEYNVVMESGGGDAMTRHYMDLFARRGWASCLWSYKLVKAAPGVQPSNWYMVTNAQALSWPDLRTAGMTEIETAFANLGRMELAVDEELRQAMLNPPASDLGLPRASARVDRAPATDALPAPWQAADIGGAAPGGQRVIAADRLAVFGGGKDIWSSDDQFRYVHQPVTGDFSFWAVLEDLEAVHRFAKAGIMLRASPLPEAAHVLIHAFPDGRIVQAWRAAPASTMREQVVGGGYLPVGFGLSRRGGQIRAFFTDSDGSWRPAPPLPETVAIDQQCLVGLAVLGYDDRALTRATFAGLKLAEADHRPEALTPPAVRNLAHNGSFEEGQDQIPGSDRAAHWGRWGHWINRESTWTPRRTGACIMAYHHWRIEGADNSGFYQDVTGLAPAKRYTFRIFVNLDPAKNGKKDFESMELRLETTRDGRQVTVASRTFKPADLAQGDQWTPLHVTSDAPSATMRVLVILSPHPDAAARDGAVKLDDAELFEAPGPEEPSKQQASPSHGRHGTRGSGPWTLDISPYHQPKEDLS